METASAAPRLAGHGRALDRLRSLNIDRLAPWGLAVLVLVAVVGFFLYPTYPNYDSYYYLLWGRELLDGKQLSFEAYRAPTEHPLAIAFGAVLSLLGEWSDRLMVLITLLSMVAVVAGVYRLARHAFTPLVALLAAALIATRFDFPFLAVRAYIDIPYIALVLWAAILEYERPRRGWPVFALLAAAGLMRPEAWVLAGLYFLWMAWDASWRDRVLYAAVTASAPVIWALTDFAVTGDPLFSLNSTSGLAEELGRQRSLADVPVALPEFFSRLVKPPVVAAGVVGLLLGLWFVPRRIVMPAILLLTGVGTFGAVGLAGLSVIERYLIVPAVALVIFAALAIGGFTMLPRGSRPRRIWAASSAVAVAGGALFTLGNMPSLSGFDSELTWRKETHKSLSALVKSEAVQRRYAAGCAPISAPSHKIIADVRWLMDLDAEEIVARSDASERRRARRGIAIYVQGGRRSLQRQGFASNIDPLTQVPAPGFVRIATSKHYSAYANC